jgi:hypothetical protein
VLKQPIQRHALPLAVTTIQLWKRHLRRRRPHPSRRAFPFSPPWKKRA